uniref:Aspartate--tRNA ligase 2, cytoplasmic-like n=1 Tax=Tanacetum cinerariifolium TaxID=118510 RepID=A0A6L2K9J9_TANCI|nr:aspartate--tRNA ligase 2, cytoplasmic-like [Tanacetum cinerariifolium]
MHILKDPSFFLTNKSEAPQGEKLGLINPLSKSSCNWLGNSYISDGANLKVIVLQIRMKCANLVRLSRMTQIVSCPLDVLGSFVMKSNDIISYFQIGISGCTRVSLGPEFLLVLSVFVDAAACAFRVVATLSATSKMGFDEWYLVNLFICGLPPDNERWVSMYKPKTLSDAYCLAKLQESTHNFLIKSSNQPLFYSSKTNDSKEGVENNVGLRDVDVSWKEDVGSKEIELRVNGMDGSSKSGNKRMGLSSLICSGEIVDGAKGRKRNEINVSFLVSECDVVMNSNKGGWTSNFNKPVDIIKECSVEQKKGRKENNNQVASDIVLGKFVNEYAQQTKCEFLSFDKSANEYTICPIEGGIQKGCNKAANRFDVCNTKPESSIKSMWNQLFNDKKLATSFNANKIATIDVGMNLEKEVASDITTIDVLNSESSKLTKGGTESVDHGKGLVVNMAAGSDILKCYNTPLFELKYIFWLLRSFEFGDDKLYQQRRWAEDLEKETKSFINAVSQAGIGLRVLSSIKLTSGLELDTQFGVLKRKLSHLDVKSVIGHLESGGLGYVKFDMWKWPTRKKINGTQCIIKPMKWKFDMWRWPKRKKERKKESYVKLMFWYEDLYQEFGLECCRKKAVVLLFMFDAVVDGSSKIRKENEVKTKFAREGIKKIKGCKGGGGDKVVYVLVRVEWASGNVGATWKCIEDVEIQVRKIYCVDRADPLPFSIEDPTRSEAEIQSALERGEQRVRVNQDTRLEYRHVDLQTPANQAIFSIESEVLHFFCKFLRRKDFRQIRTPAIIAGTSEGGAVVFGLEYYNQPACLAQSPQFHKQMAICGDLQRFFTVVPVFRAEDSHKTRIRTGICLNSQVLMLKWRLTTITLSLFVEMFVEINKGCPQELEDIREQYPFKPLKYKKETLRLRFEQGIQMLKDAGIEVDPLADLNTETERTLGKLNIDCRYDTDFYILHRFPLAVRPFYTMPCPDNNARESL